MKVATKGMSTQHQGLWALVLDRDIRTFGFCISFVSAVPRAAAPPAGAVPPSGLLFLLVSGYVMLAGGWNRVI
jgi:hypothetical protein